MHFDAGPFETHVACLFKWPRARCGVSSEARHVSRRELESSRVSFIFSHLRMGGWGRRALGRNSTSSACLHTDEGVVMSVERWGVVPTTIGRRCSGCLPPFARPAKRWSSSLTPESGGRRWPTLVGNYGRNASRNVVVQSMQGPEALPLGLGRRHIVAGARSVAVGADGQRACSSDEGLCRSCAPARKEQNGSVWPIPRNKCPIGRRSRLLGDVPRCMWVSAASSG